VEERRVLGQQFVHADHVEVLDAVTFQADHAVQADPPHDLGEEQHPCESEHIRHRRAGPARPSMRGITKNRQIGIAVPLAVMNRIRHQNGGYLREH